MEHSLLTSKIIQAAMRVHTELGPGLLESIYEASLEMELQSVGLTVKRQVDVPVVYKGKNLGIGFRADMIVNGIIVIELKSVESLLQIHKAQLITYLRILTLPVGLLINFNTIHLREGIKRCVPHNGSPPVPPSSC